MKLFNCGTAEKRWERDVRESNRELLIVSQFTLCHTFKGTKPDFHLSMAGDKSGPFFEEIVESFKRQYYPEKVQTGKFGSHMDIDMKLDGPVTVVIDSPPKKKPEVTEKQAS